MSGGVIVVHEAFGVTEHIEDVARRFRDEGYETAVPLLYHRLGDPVFSYDEPFATVRATADKLTGDTILADLDAALDDLAGRGVRQSRVAVVGFCMGGTVALLAGAMRGLGAAVSFYGGGVAESRWPGVPPLVEVAPGLRSPWLGLYGGRDSGIPVEQVEQLRRAAALAPVPTRLELFDGAGHGFFNDARAAGYHRESAEAAWPMVLSWLRMNLPT